MGRRVVLVILQVVKIILPPLSHPSQLTRLTTHSTTNARAHAPPLRSPGLLLDAEASVTEADLGAIVIGVAGGGSSSSTTSSSGPTKGNDPVNETVYAGMHVCIH